MTILGSLVRYARPRPTTSGQAPPSASAAAFSGGLEGYVATQQSPEGAVGGAVGGYVGLKVGARTASVSKAVAAGFTAGAGATVAGMLAATALQAVPLPGLGVLGLYAAVGGLSGVSGVMQGSGMGEVRDGGTAGLLFGSLALAAGGSPLLSLTSSLAGSAAALADKKWLKALTGAGVGAALGAAAGALGGPPLILLNAVLGAVSGAAAALFGRGVGQVRRNAQEDLQNAVRARLEPAVSKADPAGLMGLAALGGAIAAAPMALLSNMVFGLPGAVATVVGMAVTAGWKVHATLKKTAELKPFRDATQGFLARSLPAEQLSRVDPQAVLQIAERFSKRFTLQDYQKLSLGQFQAEMASRA